MRKRDKRDAAEREPTQASYLGGSECACSTIRTMTDCFEGLTITPEGCGDTLLTGPVVDGVALRGLLKRVSDPGMPSLTLNGVELGNKKSEEE